MRISVAFINIYLYTPRLFSSYIPRSHLLSKSIQSLYLQPLRPSESRTILPRASFQFPQKHQHPNLSRLPNEMKSNISLYLTHVHDSVRMHQSPGVGSEYPGVDRTQRHGMGKACLIDVRDRYEVDCFGARAFWSLELPDGHWW